ncbi:MAG: ThiF family adenylyltransferase [Phycisphaerae bacterium]|nr:ThiF family adenylyltransferase [Phycisphaerae bacterium]
MKEGVLRIENLDDVRNDRFHRFKLIGWWDQERLHNAKILVVGAGALGNEIVKDLALLGVGQVFVIDLDTVEHSNLSRSVMFRAGDEGRSKAEAVAESARNIYPEIRIQPLRGNAVYDLGLGVFRWSDLVIGGLDNREARLAINRSAFKVNRPWIDGAIEKLDGVARVFAPGGPCYECTMSKEDWRLLEHRRSCALLTRKQMSEGKVPTTPTSASIIAAIQVQEAVKLLHGLPTLAGKGYHFFGLTHDSYVVEYSRKEECYSHDAFGKISSINKSTAETALHELLSAVKEKLGPDTVIELNTDVLIRLNCTRCGTSEPVFRSLGRVTEGEGRCPHCKEMREVKTISTLYGDEDFLELSFRELGVPLFDIITARNGDRRLHIEFGGDRSTVLGALTEEGSQ